MGTRKRRRRSEWAHASNTHMNLYAWGKSSLPLSPSSSLHRMTRKGQNSCFWTPLPWIIGCILESITYILPVGWAINRRTVVVHHDSFHCIRRTANGSPHQDRVQFHRLFLACIAVYNHTRYSFCSVVQLIKNENNRRKKLEITRQLLRDTFSIVCNFIFIVYTRSKQTDTVECRAHRHTRSCFVIQFRF